MPIDPEIQLGLKPISINPYGGLEAMAKLQELQGLAQERQIRGQEMQFRMQSLQQAQQAQQRANQIIAGLPRKDDGTYDPGTVLQAIAGSGLPPEHSEKLIGTIDSMNKVITSWNTAKRDHQADLANALLDGHGPNDPVTPDTVHLGLAAAKVAGLANDDDEQRFTQMMGQGVDPEHVLKTVRGMGSRWAKPQEYAASAGVVYSKQTGLTPSGQPVTMQPKTEAEQAFDAATLGTPLETPTAKISAMAVRQRPDKTENEWSAFQKAFAQQVTGKPDATWSDLNANQRIQGLTQFKTIGPEASAAAAADRQSRTIAAQVAQQARAQSFTEGQAGRKEYADKVAIPYQTAMASAQTLRDTVAEAKSGNKVAANLQSLETTMAAIRAQGLNRINMTEIGLTGDAGSLWDRVQNAAGKIINGQPVDKSLQDDMLKFANILEKSATSKYQKGRKSIQATYGGLNLPDESVTAPTSTGTTGQKVGRFEIVGVK